MPFIGVSPGLMCKHIGLIDNTATRGSSFECRGAGFNCLNSEIVYLLAGDQCQDWSCIASAERGVKEWQPNTTSQEYFIFISLKFVIQEIKHKHYYFF